MTTRLIFWLSAAFVLYAYVGYPLFLWVVQLVFRRPVRKAVIEPSVSLLISAYNEEAVIAAKVRNSLQLDYPAERLEIIVVSDGSTDATAQIVRALIEQEGKGRVRLLEFAGNRGKITVLNDAVPQLRGDIVVFSDASSMLAKDALRNLIANFADQRVGAVSGVYRVLNKDRATLGRQEDLYWKYETFLKIQEAKIGTLMGAHGSLHAIRKPLYPFPPPGTINDDFVIPTAVLRRGFRIAYEPQAVAYEEAQEMEGFGRRVRIMAGNIRQLREIKNLFWPLRPLVLFCFLSHKATRIAVPLAMISLVVSNALLWRSPFYTWILLAQILFYGLALLGAIGWLKPKELRLPFYFCMINASLFAWLYRLVSQREGQQSPDEKRRHIVWT
jgi:cellulose synthase/poly-beta-1,6-N-acetylglucosamine synthase-like glycosyltransferase